MKGVITYSSPLPLILSGSKKYFGYVFGLGASLNQCPNIPETFCGDEMYRSQLELRQESGRVELTRDVKNDNRFGLKRLTTSS